MIIPVLAEAILLSAKTERMRGCHFILPKLDGEALAATETAGLQNGAAGLGLHAGAEAVNLVSLAFLGLISSEHGVYFLSFFALYRASRSNAVRRMDDFRYHPI